MNMVDFTKGQITVCQYLYELLTANGTEKVIQYITQVALNTGGDTHAKA